MKTFFLPFFLLLYCATAFAEADSLVVPIQRQRNHEKIKEEQTKCDAADGKLDGIIVVSPIDSINAKVTDAIIGKIQALQGFVELDTKIVSNNDKVRQLYYLLELVKSFRTEWQAKRLDPSLAPLLVDNFAKVFRANLDSQNMAPLIEEAPYAIAKINTEIFSGNAGYQRSRQLVYLKYCTLHPQDILPTIGAYADAPFADSLIILAANNNPKQLYDYALAAHSSVGKLIHSNTNQMVNVIATLSTMPNALFYFPFLDDLIKGKQSMDSIKLLVGQGNKDVDSVGYFRLLVKTEIVYQRRLIAKDTPVALFGTNGLREMLLRKAIQHFITPINELHEENNLAIRMKALDPLSAQELYYVIVMGENDMYTSSYKHSFNRLLQKMGTVPRGDDLLLSTNLDFFRKFIKMAANFNQLDVFLKTMPPARATVLMKAFVANLDKTTNLEDAVDVADSYSSIKDSALLAAIVKNVRFNEQRSIKENNARGKTIYSLLKTIFLSCENPNIDLTTEIGIPSIYSIDNKYLADDSGRIIQHVFFYGDEDGRGNFAGYMNSFSPKEWKVMAQKEWVEIRSLKNEKLRIFANLPLNSDKNMDDTAQAHLSTYLQSKGLKPSIIIHRGHSYWLPGTISRMGSSAKIIVLGSCGGYKNLSRILAICPDAHIISTKEIGKGDINRPIINYLNQALLLGKTILWKDMWGSLTKLFYADNINEVMESWDDYIPPYKNLGAIFLKAYNKKMAQQ